MDNKIEDIEIDLEASDNLDAQEQSEIKNSDEDTGFFQKSYMENSRKKPQLLFLVVIILLIGFVFVKKFMASQIDNKPFQVVEDIMKKSANR